MSFILNKVQESSDSNYYNISNELNSNFENIQKKFKKNKMFLETKLLNIDEIRSLLVCKADKGEILELEKSKATKIDLKRNENLGVLTQKQMQHMAIILIELIKNS